MRIELFCKSDDSRNQPHIGYTFGDDSDDFMLACSEKFWQRAGVVGCRVFGEAGWSCPTREELAHLLMPAEGLPLPEFVKNWKAVGAPVAPEDPEKMKAAVDKAVKDATEEQSKEIAAMREEMALLRQFLSGLKPVAAPKVEDPTKIPAPEVKLGPGGEGIQPAGQS